MWVLSGIVFSAGRSDVSFSFTAIIMVSFRLVPSECLPCDLPCMAKVLVGLS